MEYRITPRARDDLLNIERYTRRQWGIAQRDAYLTRLENRIEWLAQNPNLGLHRPDIKTGYYCYPEGQHLIVYLKRETFIAIIGLPHKEMDIFSYFRHQS